MSPLSRPSQAEFVLLRKYERHAENHINCLPEWNYNEWINVDWLRDPVIIRQLAIQGILAVTDKTAV